MREKMKLLISLIVLWSLTVTTLFADAINPQKELEAFQNFFKEKFSDVEFADFSNGVYAIDDASREQWQEIEEFPPYEIIVDKGEELWNTPFTNGKSYTDCFNEKLENIRMQYPYVDEERDTVITLELAINLCRKKHGEKPFKYKKGSIAYLSAYIAYHGRDKLFNVKVETKKAQKWYEKGRQLFYGKRGQLNMACADCHIYYSGQSVRSERLSPALGHSTGFPVMRSKWAATGEGIGTLHRRYAGCNKNIRAQPFKAQSPEYRALEFFESFMSNGLPLNGPSARK